MGATGRKHIHTPPRTTGTGYRAAALILGLIEAAWVAAIVAVVVLVQTWGGAR